MNDKKNRKYADAFQELLRSGSYDKVTISDICLKCDTFRANFYYHFNSKNDLAEWIFDQDFNVMKNSTDNIIYNQEDFLDKIKNHRIFYLKALDKSTSDSLYPYIKKNIIAYICSVNALNENDIDEIDRFKLEYIASGWIMTIYEWLKGMFEMSSEKLSKLLYENMNIIDLKK